MRRIWWSNPCSICEERYNDGCICYLIRMRCADVRPVFRPCANITSKDGQAHGKAASGKIRAFLRAVCRAGFRGIFRSKNKVDRKAGERGGAVNGTRLDSLRAATPSVLLLNKFRGFEPR